MTPAAVVATALSAVLRAAAAVIAGAVLASGVALVLWSITPAAEAEAETALGVGAAAFAAAHFLPVFVGGIAVTLPPLLLTALIIAVISTSAGRAPPVRGRTLEALHASVFAVAYGIGVDVFLLLFAPAGEVTPGLAAPIAVAAVGVLLALGFHPTAWRRWWRLAAPAWLQVGLRSGLVMLAALATAGAATLGMGLVAGLSDAIAITELSTHSAGDTLGMAAICLALLPNAVIAGMGYVTGAGFSLGAASFSPLSVQPADLPAVPLLAAAPSESLGVTAWLALAAPVVCALLAAVTVVRVVDTRLQRLASASVAAVVAGAVMLALAQIASGGIADGPWALTGVTPWLAGALVAGVVVLVTGTTSVTAGWGRVPWRMERPSDDGSALDDDAVRDDASPDGAEPGEPDSGAANPDDAESGEPESDGVEPDETAPDDTASGEATDSAR